MPFKDKDRRRAYQRQWDKQYYHRNIEVEREKARRFRFLNPEKVLTRQAKWRENNREKSRLASRLWAQKNKARRAFNQACRKAQLLQATPKWLTKLQLDEIRNFYLSCPEGCEVDHIYPLQGTTSCGLHVPWNLQYLLTSENRRKYNLLPEKMQ